jgi:hypothetical protein
MEIIAADKQRGKKDDQELCNAQFLYIFHSDECMLAFTLAKHSVLENKNLGKTKVPLPI